MEKFDNSVSLIVSLTGKSSYQDCYVCVYDVKEVQIV